MSLIYKIVDLLGNSLITHPKDTHLPWDKKIQRAGLHGGRGEVDLLGIIKTDVSGYVNRTGWVWTKGWGIGFPIGSLGILHHILIKCPFCCYYLQMFLLLLKFCCLDYLREVTR